MGVTSSWNEIPPHKVQAPDKRISRKNGGIGKGHSHGAELEGQWLFYCANVSNALGEGLIHTRAMEVELTG
jgi:hypothetical protein